ncbi:MAG: helical backbone metal receptor [Gemmatimonadaceae bacterium]
MLATLIVGCRRERATTTRELRDDYGAVLDTSNAAQRIVSLNPTTTEILFALGVGDRVVGRSHWDLWPLEAQRVPEVGDAIRPSVERVLASRPDLVVLYASGDNRDAADALTNAGIHVASFRIDRIADFTRVLRLLGALTGSSETAAVVADSVQRSLDAVRASVSLRAQRPRVFIHVWDNPLMAIGGGSFMSELVEISGGRNIYGDRTEPSITVSFEDLLKRNPDVVLAGPTTAGTLRESPRWRSLPAIREGRLLTYDTMLVARPSVRLGEAARSLADLFRHVGNR